jgi:hypothetical protein
LAATIGPVSHWGIITMTESKSTILAEVDLFDTIRRKQEELQTLIEQFRGKVASVRRDHIDVADHREDHIEHGAKTYQDAPNFPAFRKNSPFYGRPRGIEVHRVFNDSDTRSRIGLVLRKRGGAEIWGLLLAAIDAGLLTTTTLVTSTDKLTLRVLFPAATFSTRNPLAQIDLTNERDRARVRDEILPAMIAAKDRLLSDPGCLEDVIREDQQARARAKPSTRTAIRKPSPSCTRTRFR